VQWVVKDIWKGIEKFLESNENNGGSKMATGTQPQIF
jgi:hypothetical protein